MIVGDAVYTHDGSNLYQFVKDCLKLVAEIPAAVGVDSQFGLKYTYGSVTLGNGRNILVWDGDGFELVDGQLKKTWPLGIDEPYDFMTLPWGDDGFYYFEDRSVFRVKPDTKREQVMTGVENVMGFWSGPNGSILFYLGDNDTGYVGGIWYPNDDVYIPIRPSEFSTKLSSHDFDSVHWSDKTRHFYAVVRDGVFTVPAEQLLGRPKQTLSLQ